MLLSSRLSTPNHSHLRLPYLLCSSLHFLRPFLATYCRRFPQFSEFFVKRLVPAIASAPARVYQTTRLLDRELNSQDSAHLSAKLSSKLAESRLLPHHGGSEILTSSSTEAQIIDYIECVKVNELELQLLELIVHKCHEGGFHIAMVYLGDCLEKVFGQTPLTLLDQVSQIANDDDVISSEIEWTASLDLKDTDELKKIQDWIGSALDADRDVEASAASFVVLQRYAKVLDGIVEHHDNPCAPYRREGTGFATWLEQKAHVGELLHLCNPTFSKFLPILSFLAKRPLMDCSSGTDNTLLAFDEKWDGWLRKYPVINHILDPPVVAIEIVPPAPLNATVAALVAPLLAQFHALQNANKPLPFLGGIPFHMLDPAGPAGAVFDTLIECGNDKDARTLASILRSHFHNAQMLGSARPPIRIAVLCTSARGFRIY